jgi:hypothetical protein
MLALTSVLSGALLASTPSCPQAEPVARIDDVYAQRVAASGFRRVGFTLGVTLGATGCDTGDFCAGRGYWARTVDDGMQVGTFAQRPRVGPGFGLEMGVRPIPYVEAVAFASFGYHPTALTLPPSFPAGDPFTMTAAGGLSVFARPVAFTRWDPFVGVGLGYHTYRSRVDFTRGAGLKTQIGERAMRMLVRASVGLHVFVARQVAIGPRLDYDVLVGGQYCNTLEQVQADGTIQDAGGCNDIRQLLGNTDPEGDRAAGFPRFWRAGLDLRITL